MSSRPLFTAEDLPERERWEQRYGEPQKSLIVRDFGDRVQIGDEIYSKADLAEEDRKHPKAKDDPFKPHHYLVQKALDDLIAYQKRFPERKLLR